MRPDEVKWWQLLADIGYRTASIGKMHAEPWDDPLGFEDRIIIEGKDWLLRREMKQLLLDRLIESTDLASRILSRPTNKGAYHGYLREHPDLATRYAPDEALGFAL